MPNIVRNDIDSTSAQISVTLTREELLPKVESELKRYRQRAGIKGFRQGQAPMPYIKKMFGTSILVDTFNDMMSNEVYEYLRASQLDVLGQPLPAENQQKYGFKLDALEPEFTVVYDIGFAPKIEVQGLDKKQKYERLTIADADTIIDEDLENARMRAAEPTGVDSKIEENDIVKIDSKEVDGDYTTTITVLVKDIVDAKTKKEFLKKKKGDRISFNARLLEDAKEEHIYRKYILGLDASDERTVGDAFEGEIIEVLRREKAELNEDFFTKYFGPDTTTLEAAREKLRQGVMQFYDMRSDAMLMREFQNRLMELNVVELPEKFLKRWLLVSNEGKLTEAQIEEQFPYFVENLRWTMVRDTIKAKFDVAVTDEEVYEDYAQRVRNYFQAELPEHIIADGVKRLMQDEKDVEKTREDLETDKVFKAIRAEVSIKDKAIPSKEFHDIFDSLTKQAPASQPENADMVEVDID